MSATLKTYFAKIYSPTVSGTTTSGIVSTVKDFQFTGFTWNINAGLGETTLRFPRSFSNFGESTDISMYNQFDIYINDRESGQYGYKIYSGYVIEYSPVLDQHEEYVDVTLWGYPSEFSSKMLEDSSGSTTLTYNSYDPSDILKDAINRYDGKISYSSTSVSGTGTTVSYTFKQNTIQEVIDECVNLAPVYWYWRVGADNVLNFKLRDITTIDHTLYIGKDIKSIRAKRSAKELRNTYYFLGGGNVVYIKSSRASSQATYGKRVQRDQDERVTLQATATTKATNYLNFYDHPQLIIEVEVVDSNGDSGGYDIELFQPGQIVKMIDPSQSANQTLWDVFLWDSGYWDYPITSAIGSPMQIRSIQYGLESATLQLSYEEPVIGKRIEDINRNLESTRTQNTPTSPTVV